MARDSFVAVVAGLSLAAIAASSTGCADKNTYGRAAIAVAANVAAAAVLREATGSCYATCGYGTTCDAKSGTCKPNKPEPEPKPQCVDPDGLDCGPVATPSEEPASATDPCAGMCLASQRCVLRHGDLGCE